MISVIVIEDDPIFRDMLLDMLPKGKGEHHQAPVLGDGLVLNGFQHVSFRGKRSQQVKPPCVLLESCERLWVHPVFNIAGRHKAQKE